MSINVQFTDATQATITSYFAAPQSAESYANLGTVEPSDARWAKYYDAQCSYVQAGMPAPTSS